MSHHFTYPPVVQIATRAHAVPIAGPAGRRPVRPTAQPAPTPRAAVR
jgi:hypothetical protein